MMGQVNSEITKSMTKEEKSIKSLLAKARTYLLADPSIRQTLGGAITLGKPFSKVASSTMINDVTRSRLQFGIPIEGTLASGKIRLVANQDEIELLEVDLDDGRGVINVRLDDEMEEDYYYGDVMDADVENKYFY